MGRPKLPAPAVTDVVPFSHRVTAADRQVAAAEKADRADAARARADQNRTVTWPKAGTAHLAPGAGVHASATPGNLPLRVAPPHAAAQRAKATAATAVTVDVRDQHTAQQAGVKGVILTATGPAEGGATELTVDYSNFASAYGGDWAGRLRLVQLPSCALTTPEKAACRTQKVLASANDRNSESVTAQLSLPQATADEPAAARVVLALAAGTKSSTGDYKATPLSSSSTWNAGGSSGSFTWSYPLRVPPAAAGPAPNLSISYDSGSIDGRTGNTNNQGTWIGEGFDLTSSYVERKYATCDDDGEADKYDLCWKYDNASLVLNGKATELVKDDTSNKWHLKDDDASQVIRGTGADNGDDDGEYWTVITGDGTKYVFGQNKLPGAGATDRTNSTWTVPVFGNDSGEPGYSSGTSFAGRDKKQAWRWNLDYVVDTHDNAMTYWYAADTNFYAKNGVDKPATEYVRGGYLKEIHYGQRAGALFSATPAYSDKVVFNVDERCSSGCDTLDESHRDNWPDVPFDAICKDGDACTGNTSPAFFTRKKLTSITTSFWDTSLATDAYSPADTWSLKQEYLDPGDTSDSSDQSLWLDEIKHTGKRGTDLALPPVTFTHTWLTNRVDGSHDGKLPLYKPRLKSITSESRAKTIVSYADQDCVAGQTMPKPDTNTRRCYPVYWASAGGDPELDWFHKYPVTAVSTTDTTGGGVAVAHTYTYSGGGAWHYNDDPMTPEKERTWSLWRGYEKVTHVTGGPGGTQSKDVTVYLRGMNGDRVLGSDGKLDPDKRKSVTVTGIKAAAITDGDQYAGFVRESVSYDGANEVSGTINDPWSQKTATQHKSYADTEAYFVRTGASHARTNITSGVIPYDRVRTTVTSYDDYGMPVTVEDRGDDSKTGDEKCTRTWYARNDKAGLTSLVSRTRVVARTCGIDDVDLNLPADSTTTGDVISDTAIAYDTTTWSENQTPTQGEAQWAGRAKGYTTADAPTWQKVTTTTYDDLGRPQMVNDTNGQTISTTSYDPVAAGPLTSSTTADANTFATTTMVDPAWGSPRKVTDPNAKVAETEYDALGRVSKVWTPNLLHSLGKPATYVYDYHLATSDTDDSWVSTGKLRADGGGYNTTYEIYDALLRSRQVQSPSPVGGLLVAETLYDTRGLAAYTGSDIYDNTATPSGSMVEIDAGQAPVSTQTTYDGAGRATKVVTKNHTTTRWTSTTSYAGDTVTTTPPVGDTVTPGDGQAVATVTNALGQTTERREYDAPKPAGAHYTTTSFTYFPGGQQKAVTGPDATWSYTYDLFGRQVTATDPDKGKSTTDYNELDQVASTKDAANRVLVYEYDKVGRQRKMWGGTKTDANLRAAWEYDTLAKGQQDSATRYEGGLNGKAFTKKVTTYDSLYRPTATELSLPADDPLVAAGVPKTLAFSTAYNVDGTIQGTTEPAVAGLATEGISNTYNALGLQLTAKGTSSYLQRATYTPLGDLEQLTLAKSVADNQLYVTNSYELGTRRLTESLVTDDTHAYYLQDLHYKHDDAGNVTSISDTSDLGGISKTDNQCFTYDGYRRLTESWTPAAADCTATGRTTANLGGAAPYWSSYQYNDAGLRTNETSHAAAGDTTVDYSYSATKPHQLTSSTTARPDKTITSTWAYDATGNTWVRPGGAAGHTLDWNTEGKLSRTTTDAGQITGLSGKCLAIQGGVTTDGTPVEITSCNTSDAQKWRLKTNGTFQALGVCAAPTATASGSAVQTKACNANDAAQQWTQRDDGSLYNPNSGKCLDIPTSQATDGKDLQIYTCNTTGAQTWTVTKQTKYLYDADGQLLIRRAAADGETVLYLGATEVHLKTSGTTTTLTGNRYYTAVGQTIAVRTVSGTNNTVTFLAGDNHGTSSLAFVAGASTFTKRYTTPFGASRGTKPTTWPDDKAFLGAPADPATTLTHIGAREYDPTIGRFLSVDPVLETDKPQTLNGYTYSANNPATISDPTGTVLDDGSGGHGGTFYQGASWGECPKGGSCAKGGKAGTAPTSSTGSTGGTGGTGNSSDDFDQAEEWLKNNSVDYSINPGNGCGAVSAGSNCSGMLTPGQIAAQGPIEMLDPTGAIGLLRCSQELQGKQCSVAAAMAVLPVGGKLLLKTPETIVVNAAFDEAAKATKLSNTTRGTVSEAILLEDGTVYAATSKKGAPPALHPDITHLLDGVPVESRGLGHAKCGLVICLSAALNAGKDPTGSLGAAVITRNSVHKPNFGKWIGPCDSCRPLVEHYRIRFVTDDGR